MFNSYSPDEKEFYQMQEVLSEMPCGKPSQRGDLVEDLGAELGE